MITINKLTALDDVQAGDAMPIYSQANGDTRRAAVSVLQAYMQDNLTFPVARGVTQYATPSATGFSVTIGQGDDTWLILTPLAAYAAGTIVMPLAPEDKQTVQVVSTQAVTTLTVSGNGNGVVGAPQAITSNGFFTMRFDAVADIWHRVA
jgi:hypothetical protein